MSIKPFRSGWPRDPIGAALCAFVAVAALLASASAAAAGSEAEVRRIWQLLDYVSVDYAGAVRDGAVLEPSEFDEMREFAAASRSKIAALEARPGQAALLSEADILAAQIGARAAPDHVATLAKALGEHLLAVYPVPASPGALPDLRQAAALYQAQCASCHGAAGNGDGALGARLQPPPIAFTDGDRARQRSVFALYQAISQGIAGTAMPAFEALPEAERWALAFHVGRFAYDDEQRERGRALWQGEPALHAQVGNLAAFSTLTEAELARRVGTERAQALMAYLHEDPGAVAQPAATNRFGLARTRLDESLQAYRSGDRRRASELALAAYLDGFEPMEHALAVRDSALMRRIEAAMGAFRALITRQAPEAEIAEQGRAIGALLDAAEQALAPSEADATAAFIGSFTILLREGLEALLVVVAMIAFLRQAGRRDVLVYVHAGWIGALLAGGATWFAATYLISISGASRELTEGLSSLFAAAVLLSVGVWMHRKSMAGRWQAYLREQMAAALGRRSALLLAGLAFVAVYREVFETILFYAALWGQGADHAVIGGLIAGTLVLATVAVLLLRYSSRLPIGRFFSLSAILVGVLAVVLTGKGIAALQEAGWVHAQAIQAPRIDVLGVYPSLQTLGAQLLVAALIGAVFWFNTRAARVAAR